MDRFQSCAGGFFAQLVGYFERAIVQRSAFAASDSTTPNAGRAGSGRVNAKHTKDS
jgi:hypothetical protein